MKTTSNKDMLNAIRNQASAEYQEKVPVVNTLAEVKEVERALKDYPSAHNEFIDTLMNKVVKTEFFSKVYENPLKMLKKGTLPYGSSIEEIFVAAAKVKGFYQSQETAGLRPFDSADALVGKKKVDVKTLYIERNFAYVFDASISDAQLKAAFLNENGLSGLVNQIVGSLTSGAEIQEYRDMIKTIKAAANAKYLLKGQHGEELTPTDMKPDKGIAQMMAKVPVKWHGDGSDADSKSLAKKIREMAGLMKFPSTKYNMAGVETFSRPEDLVFLTTPEYLADLDVDVLAQAFNVSSADVNVRIILVDELPTDFRKTNAPNNSDFTSSYPTLQDDTTVKGKCLGLLMDKDFIQVIDTVNESRQFENGRALMTNLFLHKQGIIANCYFANCVALYKTEIH